LEKREAIVAVIKEIQEIKKNDKTGKKEPKLNPLESEACFMKHSGGRIRLSYNCQAAVDEKEGVIVAAEVTNEASKKQMPPLGWANFLLRVSIILIFVDDYKLQHSPRG
jgi:transposase